MSNFSFPCCCCDCFDNNNQQPPVAVRRYIPPPEHVVVARNPHASSRPRASVPDDGLNSHMNKGVGTIYSSQSVYEGENNRKIEVRNGGISKPRKRKLRVPEVFADVSVLKQTPIKNPSFNCQIDDAIKPIDLDDEKIKQYSPNGSKLLSFLVNGVPYTLNYVLVLFDDDQHRANAIGSYFISKKITTHWPRYYVENERKPSEFLGAFNYLSGNDPNDPIQVLTDNKKALLLAVYVYSSSSASIRIIDSFTELPDLDTGIFLHRLKKAETEAIKTYDSAIQMSERIVVVRHLNDVAQDTSSRMVEWLKKNHSQNAKQLSASDGETKIILTVNVAVSAPKWYNVDCKDPEMLLGVEKRRYELRICGIPWIIDEQTTADTLLSDISERLISLSEYKIDENPGMSLLLNGEPIRDLNIPLASSLPAAYSLEASFEYQLAKNTVIRG